MLCVDGDDAGAGGVERDGFDLVAGMPVSCEHLTHGLDERVHLVVVRLRGVVGVVAAAVQGVAGGGCAEAAALGVEQGDTGAEGSEVDAGDNTHSNIS